MKLVVGTFILAAAGAAANAQTAQTAPVPATAPALEARVIAELATAAQQLGGVKNAPFTADEVNESVQTLADGNRITHNSSNKVYRNGEGRMRREIKGGSFGGVLGSTYITGGGVSIIDPVRSQSVILDTEMKVAQIAELNAVRAPLAVAGQMAEVDRARVEVDRAKTLERLREVERSGQAVSTVMAAPRTAVTPVVIGAQGGILDTTGVYTIGASTKYETRMEELGTRDFDGVQAEGRRTITTIPAGAIGNERPIETVYERWYSKDLGMVVYSKRSDPRTGETTYELKNIVRAEPDPALFDIPTGYKKVSSNGTIYRTAAPAKAEVERASAAKPTPAATYVKNNRP